MAAVLFADRPEWADVTPLEQYDSQLNPLAPIVYTVEYKDASCYFRGIVKTGEKSLRVLELTESLIRLNPAHYTAWQYRYETLLILLFPDSKQTYGPDLLANPLITNELIFLDELATNYLKTYQVWHHRRLVVSLTRDWRRELVFTKRILGCDPDVEVDGDGKNYHTWSYRQWILCHFGGIGTNGPVSNVSEEAGDDDDKSDMWLGEIEFVDSMLSSDLRNNSAWHHRFFVVWGSGVHKGEEDREVVLRRELTYVKQKISLAPNNPSAWNYLRGILRSTTTPFSSLVTFVEPYTRLKAKPESQSDDEVVDLDNPLPGELAQLPCVEALEFLADVYEEQVEVDGEKAIKAVVAIWTSLAEEHDPIRKNYWRYRVKNVTSTNKD